MGEARTVRIAAVGDLHLDGRSPGRFREAFARVNREADVLAVCGDITTHGEPDQARAFVDELEGVEIPVVAVLGNHDHEHEAADEVADVLCGRGVHVLDGDPVVVDGVGFAGVKGFGGGFGRGALGPFGEPIYKAFVQAAIDEALKLETALRKLDAETRVVLLHYAPIAETLHGEPEVIWPFLGSSRLLPPIETYRPDVVFHGHAHIGSPEGSTPSGIPVYNVAHSLLMQRYRRPFRIWEAAAPERRRR
jgi:Icc-related predicted phosphoesterase